PRFARSISGGASHWRPARTRRGDGGRSRRARRRPAARLLRRSGPDSAGRPRCPGPQRRAAADRDWWSAPTEERRSAGWRRQRYAVQLTDQRLEIAVWSSCESPEVVDRQGNFVAGRIPREIHARARVARIDAEAGGFPSGEHGHHASHVAPILFQPPGANET